MSMTNMTIPGDIVKEYLDEYGITQKEMSARTGISTKHISNVLNGKSRLTEDFALKLEKVIPEVPASYWLNYETKFREHIARQEERYHLDRESLPEIARRFHFHDVFRGLKLNLDEQAIEMLKLLRISSFSQFSQAYQSIEAEFMEDGGQQEAIAIWLSICESEIELQNDDLEGVEYSAKRLEHELDILKQIANNENLDAALGSCRKLLNSLGIYFVICDAVPGCKIRGALKTYKGKPAIFISKRFQKTDYVWFAIIHEIAHLLLHYQKNTLFISYEDGVEDHRSKEKEANHFSKNFFIDPAAYNVFLQKKDFSSSAVRTFAADQRITLSILIGRLQHDGYIAYSDLSWLK